MQTGADFPWRRCLYDLVMRLSALRDTPGAFGAFSGSVSLRMGDVIEANSDIRAMVAFAEEQGWDDTAEKLRAYVQRTNKLVFSIPKEDKDRIEKFKSAKRQFWDHLHQPENRHLMPSCRQKFVDFGREDVPFGPIKNDNDVEAALKKEFNNYYRLNKVATKEAFPLDQARRATATSRNEFRPRPQPNGPDPSDTRWAAIRDRWLAASDAEARKRRKEFVEKFGDEGIKDLITQASALSLLEKATPSIPSDPPLNPGSFFADKNWISKIVEMTTDRPLSECVDRELETVAKESRSE